MNQQVLERAKEICISSKGQILKVVDVGTLKVFIQLKEGVLTNDAYKIIQEICPGVKQDELEFEHENDLYNFDWCMHKREN